jgi:hypothetical protein
MFGCRQFLELSRLGFLFLYQKNLVCGNMPFSIFFASVFKSSDSGGMQFLWVLGHKVTKCGDGVHKLEEEWGVWLVVKFHAMVSGRAPMGRGGRRGGMHGRGRSRGEGNEMDDVYVERENNEEGRVTGVVNFLEGKNLCEFSPKKLKQKKRLRTSDGVENQNTEMATSASSLEEGRRAQ